MLLAELDGKARAYLTANLAAEGGPILEIFVDADSAGSPLAVQEPQLSATLSDGITTHSITFSPAPTSDRPAGEVGASKFVAALPASVIDAQDLTVTVASLNVGGGALEVSWESFAPRAYARA